MELEIFYDKNANQISYQTWNDMRSIDAYRIINSTEFPGGKVSTVWTGNDHTGEKYIFETAFFGGPLAECEERYQSLAEARFGHLKWVERLNKAFEGLAQAFQF